MSVKKFKFVSPGVFLREIDQSQIPKEPGGIGPVIIGTARRGPALKPVKVESFQEFVEVFGEPISGQGDIETDVWRHGAGKSAATYGAYAAQAYLKANINSPITYIRLLGVQGDDAKDTADANPGWTATAAYGIFGAVVKETQDASVAECTLLGTLYTTDATVEFGVHGGNKWAGDGNNNVAAANTNLTSVVSGIVPVIPTGETFEIAIKKGTTISKAVSFNKGAVSAENQDSVFIRDRLNTDPTSTNDQLVSSLGSVPNHGGYYWLGETFEEEYHKLKQDIPAAHVFVVFIAEMSADMADRNGKDYALRGSTTPWVIPQWEGAKGTDIDHAQHEKLFRIHTVQEGEESLGFFVEIQFSY